LEADVLVNTYDARSSRRLAASIVAGAGSPLGSGGPPAGARVIEAGGGWHLSTWRENLRRLVDRSAVTALALRTSPRERQLPDTDWAQITRTMANEIGLAERPWAAVRTNPTTVALLTGSANGPLPIEAARELARSLTTSYRLRAAAQLAPDRPVDDGTEQGLVDDQVDQATPSPRGLAQLSFAAPPSAASDSAAGAAPQPATAPGQQPTNRPHSR
jgi:hypothetical protein